MSQNFDNIPETALDWHRAGRGAALATVVETWGSAPRPVGSQLAIAGDTEIAGSVSGGCVEGAVIIEAMDALEDGKPRMMEFGVSDDQAFAVGLACGGKIRVMIEPIGPVLPEDMLTELVAARAGRVPVAYVVNPDAQTRRLATKDGFPDRFRSDKSGFEGDEFVAIHNPPLKMIMVGAVHITQPLLVMARLAGYDPVLVDPRAAFGSKARFPNEEIIDDWPDEALQAQGLDVRTAVVTLSHDPKIDDPALTVALRSDAFYIGSLGSTRTHAKRVNRLKAAGFADDEIARIHAPVGLDIGSKSPAEIALSIMAQITQTLRKSG
ncbi:XdhC family protein [Profundibacter sp.]|uniref:XdhC family protein n=1 Tax=Profundibacter sp. TaxID=3101071 RepID=UPI003D13D756